MHFGFESKNIETKRGKFFLQFKVKFLKPKEKQKKFNDATKIIFNKQNISNQIDNSTHFVFNLRMTQCISSIVLLSR